MLRFLQIFVGACDFPSWLNETAPLIRTVKYWHQKATEMGIHDLPGKKKQKKKQEKGVRRSVSAQPYEASSLWQIGFD